MYIFTTILALTMRLDPEWLALRSVEIQRCFSASPSVRVAFLDLPRVMKIGQIARLANMVRRRDVISADSVHALGALLEMQPDTIEYNLNIMEKLGWLSLKKESDGNFSEVEDHVPRMDSVLNKLGEIYSGITTEIPLPRLSKVEEASIYALDLCSKKPCSIEALKSEIAIDDKTFAKVRSLAESGRYLEPIELKEKTEALWSPIYYYNRYDEMKRFFQRQTVSELTPIGEAIEEIAQNVGTPIESLSEKTQKAAAAAVGTNAVLPLTLWFPDDSGNPINHTFLFPPLSDFQDSNPKGQIFEKPKVMLASLRLGENFAPTTKIKYPSLVLNRIIRDGKLGNPHSDAFDQYRVAASRGLFVLKKEKGVTRYGNTYEGWMPHLIQSEENIKALQIVESLLTPATERVSKTLTDDIQTADNVFKRSLTCLEPLEFRGSSFANTIKADADLMRSAEKMAFTVWGGAYE